LQDSDETDIRIRMLASELETLLSDPVGLMSRIIQALDAHASGTALFDAGAADLAATSAVLLLMSRGGEEVEPPDDICLILNKRSAQVRQPGDLCYPGGSVSTRFDFNAARMLALPFGPLGRWPRWKSWRRERRIESRWLALYFATALREAFEEMRLNPLRVKFLGPLPHHRLVLFRRLIYPLAAWVPRQRRFKPNWEVARIVRIPLRRLMDSEHYIRYRLTMALPPQAREQVREVPAFRFRSCSGQDILWGATFRITMAFLKLVFDFEPPAMESLPQEDGHLGKGYLTGERALLSRFG
jgi:8-oxo-dGTP pyrophosphatase MutT (NUDIX family)